MIEMEKLNLNLIIFSNLIVRDLIKQIAIDGYAQIQRRQKGWTTFERTFPDTFALFAVFGQPVN